MKNTKLTDGVKSLYIGGHMLNLGSQMQRAMEREKAEEIGIKLYNPMDNKDINDKQANKNDTGLAERIVAADTNAILYSDVIMIEPDPAALGTITELGQIYMFNMLHDVIMDIMNDTGLSAEEKVKRINEYFAEHPRKLVLPHMQDVRRHDAPEVGDRRSWGCNAYVYGVCLDLTNGKGFYEYDEIWQVLRDLKEEGDVLKQEQEDEVVDIDGFAVFPLPAETDGIINDIEDLIDLLMNDISDIEYLDDEEVSLDDVTVGDKVVLKTMDEMLEDGAKFENGDINFPDEPTGFSVIPEMFGYLGKEFVVDGVLHDLVYDVDDEEIMEEYYSLMAHDGSSLDYGFTKPMIKKVIRG